MTQTILCYKKSIFKLDVESKCGLSETKWNIALFLAKTCEKTILTRHKTKFKKNGQSKIDLRHSISDEYLSRPLVLLGKALPSRTTFHSAIR